TWQPLSRFGKISAGDHRPRGWEETMMFSLKDRVALVTGGGRGIGRAIAFALAAQGARVAVTARSAAELDEVVGTIRTAGGEAIALSADLARVEVAAQLAAQVAARLGPIDILVNNAGVGSSGSPRPMIDFDDTFW